MTAMTVVVGARVTGVAQWWADQPLLMQLVLGFTVLAYAFETALDLRQRHVLQRPMLPRELQGVVAHDKFIQARAYSLDKMRLHLVHAAVSLLQELLTLALLLLPWLWRRTEVQYKWGWLDGSREVEHSLTFLAACVAISQVLELPFALYSTFVVEQRHGFNKQTLRLFFTDMAKGLLLTAVIGGPVTAAVIVIARRGGAWLVPALWLFSLLFSLFFLTIYPVLIAPLFNKFEPLAEGTLRTSIEQLASSLKFPLKKIFVVDGSTRSAHSNAYLYGFFNNKRVVLYDTLIKQCTEEEVLAVVGHEMGHWKLNHVLKSFFTSQVLSFLNFAGYAYVSSSASVFHAFGFDGEDRPVVIGFLLFSMISAPVSHILTFLLNVVSRTYEFQADSFAVSLSLGKPLRAGLIKLQEENKSTMATDPLYSAYHYSHPPFAERLSALDSEMKRVESSKGKTE